jgi:hypothetical protein
MPGAHPDAEENHLIKHPSHARDRDVAVFQLSLGRVLSTRRVLLDAIMACHSLAHAMSGKN